VWLFLYASIGRGDGDRVEMVTALVLTVKVALLAPARTVTLEGTLAATLLRKALLARLQ